MAEFKLGLVCVGVGISGGNLSRPPAQLEVLHLAAVFDVISCKILEDIILVKILQILETAAAGRIAAVVLSVSGIFFIVSVLSPGWVGGCVRAAAAGISKTDRHAIKRSHCDRPLIANAASLSSLLDGRGAPW